MGTDLNYRQERIERLLKELEYEVKRGMIEHEIDETLTFRFVVPISLRIPEGVVFCEFKTRPTHRSNLIGMDLLEPKLKVVK